MFVTYENRNNPHVTIHRAHCGQVRKRGGVHSYGQGKYKDQAIMGSGLAIKHPHSTLSPLSVAIGVRQNHGGGNGVQRSGAQAD